MSRVTPAGPDASILGRASVRERARRLRPVGGAAVALLLWWPLSYAGLAPFLELPAGSSALGVILLGAFAASAATGVLVRDRWPRIAVATGLPVVCLLRAGVGGYPAVAVLALAVVVLVGVVLGARASGTLEGLALLMALVAGLAPASGSWWGPVLAVALALPVVPATAERVTATTAGVVGVLLAWLTGVVLLAAVPRGFAGTPRRTGLDILTEGASSAGLTIEEHYGDLAREALRGAGPWYAVALGLAILGLLARGLRWLWGRRS